MPVWLESLRKAMRPITNLRKNSCRSPIATKGYWPSHPGLYKNRYATIFSFSFQVALKLLMVLGRLDRILTRMVNAVRSLALIVNHVRSYQLTPSVRSKVVWTSISPSLSQGISLITAFTSVEDIDSLSVNKKLVFEEKKYSVFQMMKAPGLLSPD